MSKEIKQHEVLTDRGLNLPVDITEEEFFKVGGFLSEIERGYQWALGDWYNAIPWGDKKAACEKAGLNYRTAERCGVICRAFQITARAVVSFRHHQVLAIEDLTSNDRSSLLKQAEKNGWTSRKLTEERDKLLGHWKEPVKVDEPDPDAIAEFVEKEVGEVPDRYKRRITKAVHAVGAQMAHDFEEEVAQQVSQRTKEQRKRLSDLEKKAEAEFENAIRLKRGVKAYMTEKEFKLVRSCLHPDKHGGDPKYAKAFDIFNRLAETSVELKVVSRAEEAL